MRSSSRSISGRASLLLFDHDCCSSNTRPSKLLSTLARSYSQSGSLLIAPLQSSLMCRPSIELHGNSFEAQATIRCRHILHASTATGSKDTAESWTRGDGAEESSSNNQENNAGEGGALWRLLLSSFFSPVRLFCWRPARNCMRSPSSLCSCSPLFPCPHRIVRTEFVHL